MRAGADVLNARGDGRVVRLLGAGRSVLLWDARKLVLRRGRPRHHERRPLHYDNPGTHVEFLHVVFGRETVMVTRTGGGAVVDVPEVDAPLNLTVERRIIPRARRVAAGALLSPDTSISTRRSR